MSLAAGIEQAGYLYDCLALLVGDVWRSSRQGLFANAHYRRALSLSYLTAGTVLDKVARNRTLAGFVAPLQPMPAYFSAG
jgi:hypothetical protein